MTSRTTSSAKATVVGERVPPASLAAFMDSVRQQLRRYCVMLAYRPRNTEGFKGWEFATGTLLQVEGHRLILTAGHWAKNIQSHLTANSLEAVLISYAHVSGDLKTFQILPDSLSASTLQAAGDFDAAILIPPSDLIREIEQHENVFFTEKTLMHGKLESPHFVMLFGYPSQGHVTTKKIAFYSRSGGRTLEHHQLSLGSVALQTTLLKCKDTASSQFGKGFDCSADEFLFEPTLGKINSRPESGIESAKGMSGGPVVAVQATKDDPEAFFKPRLLGMQYQERYIPHRTTVEITGLDIVGIRRVLKWIKKKVLKN